MPPSASRTFQIRTQSCKRRIHESSTGSAKLFADAAREEAEEEAKLKQSIETTSSLISTEHANWTGEESTRDAVLRMLVDKYKPLRTGTLRSAEEKLKEALPQPTSTPQMVYGRRANEPLLPSVEGHRPWHTVFKPPSTQTASVRLGQFASMRPRIAKSSEERETSGNAVRENNRKSKTIERLVKARESTLDYQLGIQSSATGRGRPNPVSLKGWTNMIEDKIEVCTTNPAMLI